MSSVGTDNRQEVLDGAVPELMRTVLHKSIGVCVLKKDLVLQGDHYVPATDVPTLGTYLQAANPSATGVDSTIRFQNQSSLGFATAYVVSPNIVVTAGRCLVDKKHRPSHPAWLTRFTSSLDSKLPRPAQRQVASNPLRYTRSRGFWLLKLPGPTIVFCAPRSPSLRIFPRLSSSHPPTSLTVRFPRRLVNPSSLQVSRSESR
ncbi:hypothetical protein B0H14DRAFT_465492 [Mycena olivaceomarginata]|nr:hypothetical protein B0H14DRAFT_465492 [Mycena olivaceomarginata]